MQYKLWLYEWGKIGDKYKFKLDEMQNKKGKMPRGNLSLV
jgi:hypothetical protein